MPLRNVILAMLAIALVIAGAAVSWTQQGRFDDDASARDDGPTPTLVVIQDCPYGEASCILGQGIERALQRGNVTAVMDFGAPTFYICPGPGRSDTPSPLCDRVGADVGVSGYPVKQRFGERQVIPPGMLQARLDAFVQSIQHEARDEVGGGGLTLYAFSCAEAPFPAQNVSCAKEGIILSAIVDRGDGPRREVLVFWAQGGFAGRTLPFTELWDGAVGEEEVAVLFETGGRLQDLGEVDVIDQSLPR